MTAQSQISAPTTANVQAAPKLKRSLGLWMATALVIGKMIGPGVFLLPASLKCVESSMTSRHPVSPLILKSREFWSPPLVERYIRRTYSWENVERVVINPYNRRVTSFVAYGNLPDLRHIDEYRFSYEIPSAGTLRRRPYSGGTL